MVREGDPQGASPAADDAARRWRRRPLLSRALRVAALLTPPLLATGFSIALSRTIPAPQGVVPAVLWWLLVTAATLCVLFALELLAQRLLPLAALLNLSMVFPDHAPARYKLMRGRGRPKDLERWLDTERRADAGDLRTMSAQTVLELVAALSVHDRRTRGHSERVRIFTDLIGEQMHIPQHDMDRLRWAAMLHDIGKLRVPATILNKPGKPTPAEWNVLGRHPLDGAALISPVAAWLGPWAVAVEHHHERWDGTGYPRGLRGDDISMGGRIVAVADAYETMTAARPYKRPMSPTAAREELVRCAGSHFDPAVVRAFLGVSLGRLWRTVGASALLSQVPLLPQVASGLTRVGTQMAPGAAATGAAVALVSVSGITASAGGHATVTPVAHAAQVAPARPTPGASGGATSHTVHAPAPGAKPAATPAPTPQPGATTAAPPPVPASGPSTSGTSGSSGAKHTPTPTPAPTSTPSSSGSSSGDDSSGGNQDGNGGNNGDSGGNNGDSGGSGNGGNGNGNDNGGGGSGNGNSDG